MLDEFNLLDICLVFTGAAVLGGLALYARQSLLVAYILLGGLLGPWGFALVKDASVIGDIGHVGIVFLLFLLGLNLHPQKLLHMLREALVVTLTSSLVFAVLGASIALLFGFAWLESVLIGCVMTFSSTILGLKLLPTTALHHRRMGEIIISVLLLQDMFAIVILAILQGSAATGGQLGQMLLLLASLPALVAVAFAAERWLLNRLILKFDTIQEYIFLVAIGWCVGFAELAHWLGLSYEMGAFIAGVALATSRMSTFIAESLKPLRDFFLIMFFFSLGAGFDIGVLPDVIVPAVVLAAAMLVLKPWVFEKLLRREGEADKLAREISFRLGQTSEFSLLIAVLAVQAGVLGERGSSLIQTATLLGFIVSSYIIMLRFPTPIAVDARLRRD